MVFHQPIWKICSSKWVHLPQIFGMKIPKNIWVATTQISFSEGLNSLVFGIGAGALRFPINFTKTPPAASRGRVPSLCGRSIAVLPTFWIQTLQLIHVHRTWNNENSFPNNFQFPIYLLHQGSSSLVMWYIGLPGSSKYIGNWKMRDW